LRYVETNHIKLLGSPLPPSPLNVDENGEIFLRLSRRETRPEALPLQSPLSSSQLMDFSCSTRKRTFHRDNKFDDFMFEAVKLVSPPSSSRPRLFSFFTASLVFVGWRGRREEKSRIIIGRALAPLSLAIDPGPRH
jgi:hypothetical protein